MDEYLKVLAVIKKQPRTYQCDFVRQFAKYVAEAASRGHISNLNTSGRTNGAWEITAKGTKFLKSFGGCV